MPTYEYECTACLHRFEQFQSMKAERIKECPVCKGITRRLIGGGAGIIFKGSGFYQTDYRSASYQKKAEADKPASAAPKDSAKKPDPPVSPASSNPAPSK